MEIEVIKKLKTGELKLGNNKYKPYTIGSLPPTFAYLYDEIDEKQGISEWFNYKGLTYVPST